MYTYQCYVNKQDQLRVAAYLPRLLPHYVLISMDGAEAPRTSLGSRVELMNIGIGMQNAGFMPVSDHRACRAIAVRSDQFITQAQALASIFLAVERGLKRLEQKWAEKTVVQPEPEPGPLTRRILEV